VGGWACCTCVGVCTFVCVNVFASSRLSIRPRVGLCVWVGVWMYFCVPVRVCLCVLGGGECECVRPRVCVYVCVLLLCSTSDPGWRCCARLVCVRVRDIYNSTPTSTCNTADF